MPDDVTPEEIRKLAADVGLDRLTDEHLQALLRATKAARGRRAALRVETLAPTDEPAHVLRLGTERVR
jgi:hypothetical protein